MSARIRILTDRQWIETTIEDERAAEMIARMLVHNSNREVEFVEVTSAETGAPLATYELPDEEFALAEGVAA